MSKGNKLSRERILLGIGVILLAILAASIVIVFTFVINNIIPAITLSETESNGSGIQFDLEGFEKLNL